MTTQQQQQHQPQRGSVLHLLISTTPLLAVMSYFLYLADIRPDDPRYNLPADADERTIEEAFSEPLIPLLQMLYVFCSAVTIWSALLIYLLLFVPRRRRLLRGCLEEGSKINDNAGGDSSGGGVMKVWGNVRYIDAATMNEGRCFHILRSDSAWVDYTIEIKEDSPMRKYLQSKDDATVVSAATTTIRVERKIRTYFVYDRERVPILVLPDLPRSGLPKEDVEADIATHVGRDRINALFWVVGFWMFFSLGGALFLLFQMEDIDNEYENDELGWIIFSLWMVIGLPIVAGGGNMIRYLSYKQWLTDSGTMEIVSEDRKGSRASTTTNLEEGTYHAMS